MYSGLLDVHSLLRWIILVLLVVAIFKSYSGMRSGRPFTAGDKKIGLFLMISAHTQLLIGLYEWIAGPLGVRNLSNVGMKAAMQDDTYRFYGVEHIVMMLIAIVLITIGRGVSKKNLPDPVKHRKTFWFFVVALIIILASIPWPFRAGLGRPWFF